MYKKLFSLFVAFVAAGNCYAQSQGPEIPKVIPPSPNAANLGQYINTPVGLYTGTPQISVPIWTISEGSLKLPISLSYKSGGIKVSEMASSSGLGWVLNAGGTITRSVVGLPDETPSVGYPYTIIPTPPLDEYETFIGRQISTGAIDGQQDLFFFSLPEKSGKFVFDKSMTVRTIPKQNFKFSHQNATNVSFSYGENGTEICIPQWTVTDDNGVIYRFEVYEKTSTSVRELSGLSAGNGSRTVNTWYLTEMTSPTGDKITFAYDDVQLSYDLPPNRTSYSLVSGSLWDHEMTGTKIVQRQFVETKRLRTITFSNGSVEFVPSPIGRADLIGDSALEKIVIKNKDGAIIKQFKFQYQYLVENTLLAYNSINFSGQNNYFQSGTTLPSEPLKRRLMLQQILEQDNNGNALNNGHQFEYFHDIGLPQRGSALMDHWGYANKPESEREPFFVGMSDLGSIQRINWYLTGKEANFNYGKQGSLSRITYPTGGFTEYDFEANEVAPSPLVPPVVTKSDFTAGFEFTHATYGKPWYDEYHPYEVRPSPDGIGTIRNYYTEFVISERKSYKIQIVNMPYYPNGGMSYYIENVNNPNVAIWREYLNNTYYLTLNPGMYRLYHCPSPGLLATPSDPNYTALYSASIEGLYEVNVVPGTPGAPLKVGGIRVKGISQYDPIIGNAINKAYSYELDGSSGQLVSTPLYTYPLLAEAGIHSAEYKVFNYNSVYPLSTTHNSYVGYEFVTEKKTLPSGQDLGKSEYSYIGPNQEPDILFKSVDAVVGPGFSDYPNPPVDNRDWLRGFLTNQQDYENKNNTYSLVRTVSNTYTKYLEPVSPGVKIDVFRTYIDIGKTDGIINFYNYNSGYIYLDKSEETMINNGVSTKKTTTFEQSPTSLLPVRETLLSSDGSKKHTFSTYPLEYAAGTPFIDSLVYKNNVNVPIEKVTVKEYANGDKVVLSGNITKYQTNHKGLKDAELVFEHPAATPLSTFNFSNRGTGVLPNTGTATTFSADAKYQQRLKYQTYDDKGNLLSAKLENGSSVCYIWSYNQQYPVAEIKNADYAAVVAALGGASAVNSFAIGAPANKAAIDAFLAPVRNHTTTLKDAQVTTYTYDALVGMKSSTDAKGQTSYFDYDTFQRLKYVKDQNGNIIKANEYHYKP
ncbi:hypothetical protein [Pedobacter africanus]|uniref:YD repeat-containing protein n=1 Tax=Pedobacter africanus TaxID=151894 RepID=A0A1W2BRQ8_9SPHI|nr:hypothetical protein [Pedobacter africanus]SMC75579.1 YD repeat-containing protein [Pedobacter africanus]